ncbi:MAG: CoA transferase [Sphingobium sp.]|nr:CoA transferase [Sphingobium sp.]
MATTNILSNVRILDMTTVMFGPYCTETLANMGADIIKLEPESGDEVRRVGKPRVSRRMGPVHLTMNRGKRSVIWDLKSAEGRGDFDALVLECDVIIHNLRQEAVDRAGLSYERLSMLRPDLIYVHCTGFGTGGPYAGRPAYDDIIQATAGATSLIPRVTGSDDPRFLPLAIADKVSGLHAVYAVLGALYHRERTGEGQAIEVPMLESFTHFLLQEHLHDRVFVPPTGPAGYPRQLDPDRQPMRTSDGHIVVAPYTDERWLRFFEMVGREDILTDPRLETPLLRLKNVAIMQRAMADIVARDTTANWLEWLAAADIPACRVNSLDDLPEDPHLKAVGFFEPLEHPTEGPYLGLKPPVRFGAGEPVSVRHAPIMGEHSEEVRREVRGAMEADEA